MLDDCTSAWTPAAGQSAGWIGAAGAASLTSEGAATRLIGSWCWRRQVGLSTHGACWTPAHLPGESGPLRPGREGKMAHTVKRPAALCCLPAEHSSLGPPPGPGTGRAPLQLLALTPLGRGAAAGGCLIPALTRGPWRYPIWDGRWTAFCLRAAWGVPLCQFFCPLWQGPRRHSGSAAWGRRRWMNHSRRMVSPHPESALPSWGGCPVPADRHPMGIPRTTQSAIPNNVSTVAAETMTQLLSSTY